MPEAKGWMLVRVAGLLGEVIERSKVAFSALATVGGLGGALTYYYSIYALYQTDVLILLALFVLVAAVVVTWQVCAVLYRRRDAKVASEFLRLENVYLPFEREAVRLFYELALDKKKSIDLRNLEEFHADYLVAICNAVAEVFEIRKVQKRPITANIKRIEQRTKDGKQKFVYGPLVRSTNYEQNRLRYDAELEDCPLDIQSNYVYRRIFDPGYEDDFFLDGDIPVLLDLIKNSKERSIEPNDRSTKFYKSFTIFPILGLVEKVPYEGETPASLDDYMQYKKQNVFGLICVDSGKRNAFNQGADTDVIQQLTSYAFGAFRLVQAINDLARQRGLVVETRHKS
jgi:hypothetical protein